MSMKKFGLREVIRGVSSYYLAPRNDVIFHVDISRNDSVRCSEILASVRLSNDNHHLLCAALKTTNFEFKIFTDAPWCEKRHHPDL
jgi:hypothetical protein